MLSELDMLTHAQIWAAIDTLAAREGLSASGLARLAGLDSTTFNRSKRQNAKGQFRWPSTESIAKVLAATGASIESFLQLVATVETRTLHVPYRPLEDTQTDWFNLAGLPAGAAWDEISFPGPTERDLFALEIRGDRFAPCYHDGDTLILSPHAEPRRGDRVLVVSMDGAMTLKIFARKTATHFHAQTLVGAKSRTWLLTEIRFLHRIIWASQ
jgi:phage repressor protein C with HTH and peptisase S24 domain